MTFQTFPLSSGVTAPSYYTQFTWTARNAIHYVGDSVVATLNKFTATHYDVVCLIESHHAGYDLGEIVATGTVTGTTLNLGTFLPGCYRVRLYGASTDANYGDSYGASNFGVIKVNSSFPTLPASVDNPLQGGGYIPKGQGSAALNDPIELITKACLGIGTSRISVGNMADPEAGVGGFDKLSDAVLAQAVHTDYWLNPSYLDPVRERKQWCSFPNGTTDVARIEPNYLDVALSSSNLDGSKVFVEAIAGGGTGGSDIIRVYYPDASTLVETYDNLTTQDLAIAAINGVSNYIWVWRFGINARLNTLGKTAIGNARAAGIRLCVSTLYPLGITHFEGPSNEPSFSTNLEANVVAAHHTRLMQGFVHQGHLDAKAMGPCTVDIAESATPAAYRQYLQHWVDHGEEPDGFSFHDYNSIVNGDINCGRNTIEAWIDVLREFGWHTKERWQTEATHNFSSVAAGVYHPGRSSVTMAMILLWEQYGIPFEKNPIWYDYSHGFWSYSAWLFHGYSGDKSPNPYAITASVYAQEVFGKAFHHAIDFRHVIANRMFVGNVYGSAATGSVAAMMCASWMPNSTVTLEILGSSAAIVAVDSSGNEQSYSQTAGEITVPVTNQPTYVRLPVGVNMRVSHIRDWGMEAPSVSAVHTAAALGGVSSSGIGDDSYLSLYVGGTGSTGISHSGATVPDEATLFFSADKTVSRVVTFHGPAWESMPYPLDYTVETLPSGTALPTNAAALPGTAANSAAAGNVAWATPSKALADDNDLVIAANMTAGQTTQYLQVTNFGFAIPAGATVLGVVVGADCGTSGGTNVTDQTIKLIDAGSMAGNNNANAVAWSWFPTTVKSWGSSSDLWGIALTPAKINASDFGVSIRATNSSTLASLGVDYVRITVYYTLGTWPLPWNVQSDPAVHVASSVLWGTDGTNAGCQRETFTQEPWITDDTFAATTPAIRYNVAALSYGGEPDTNCITQGGLSLSGHGMAVPKMAVQEIAVLSSTLENDGRSAPTATRAPGVAS